MEIRVMKPEDYEAAYALWAGSQGVGLRSLDDSRAGVTRFLRRNPATSFVAAEKDETIGTILCGHDGRRGFIYHTVVAPDYRGKGIGKAMVGAALQALRAEGIHKAALVVFRSNAAGNAFWQAMGFDERGDLSYRNITLTAGNI